jgi:hypothetical protein
MEMPASRGTSFVQRTYLVLLAWRFGLLLVGLGCLIGAVFLPAFAVGAAVVGSLLLLVSAALTIYSAIRVWRGRRIAIVAGSSPRTDSASAVVSSNRADGWIRFADARVMRLIALELAFCVAAVVFFVLAALVGVEWRDTLIGIGLLELAIAAVMLVVFVALGRRRGRARDALSTGDSERALDWPIISDPQEFSDRIAPSAPVRTYPSPPLVVRMDHGLGYPTLGCRYVVPCEGELLIQVLHAAALRVPHLIVVEITDRSAHFGNRAIAGIGYEVLVAHFTSVGAGTTRMDWMDKAPQGVVNSAPSHLEALLAEIVHEIGVRQSSEQADGYEAR